jgi:hypothetical protein
VVAENGSTENPVLANRLNIVQVKKCTLERINSLIINHDGIRDAFSFEISIQ